MSSDSFDDGGVGCSGGFADGLQADVLACAFEFAEKVSEHASARGAQGMADGNRSAVDVQFVVGDIELPLKHQGDPCEGFIHLEQVDVFDSEPGLLERLACRVEDRRELDDRICSRDRQCAK